jgi:hypothetical protein
MFCPECGSQNINEDTNEWIIASCTDPGDVTHIPENECQDCYASFWTGQVRDLSKNDFVARLTSLCADLRPILEAMIQFRLYRKDT